MWSLVSITLSLAGLIMVYIDRVGLIMAIRSYSWQTTMATIHGERDTSFVLDGLSNQGPQRIHYRNFTYTFGYSVNGMDYTTQNYCFGAQVDESSASFKTGDQVILYFDPECPAFAVVRRGIMPSQLVPIGLIVGGIFMQLLF
jgi:hypothetical protein